MSSNTQRDAEGHYAVYSDYAKTLRTWLVAYGVGGPVLFLSQKSISDRICQSGYAIPIIFLFFAGVASQIFVAMINKWVNWFLYAEANPKHRGNQRIYDLVVGISNCFWIDMILDIVSVITVGLATLWVLLIFVDW